MNLLRKPQKQKLLIHFTGEQTGSEMQWTQSSILIWFPCPSPSHHTHCLLNWRGMRGWRSMGHLLDIPELGILHRFLPFTFIMSLWGRYDYTPFFWMRKLGLKWVVSDKTKIHTRCVHFQKPWTSVCLWLWTHSFNSFILQNTWYKPRPLLCTGNILWIEPLQYLLQGWASFNEGDRK